MLPGNDIKWLNLKSPDACETFCFVGFHNWAVSVPIFKIIFFSCFPDIKYVLLMDKKIVSASKDLLRSASLCFYLISVSDLMRLRQTKGCSNRRQISKNTVVYKV